MTKKQQNEYDYLVKNITNARERNFFDWYRYDNRYLGWYGTPIATMTDEEVIKSLNEREAEGFNTSYAKKQQEYENLKVGIVRTSANSLTLRALERAGLIEIIFDAANERVGIDTVKVVNI